jgi:hypothetical protein
MKFGSYSRRIGFGYVDFVDDVAEPERPAPGRLDGGTLTIAGFVSDCL